jgi:hypothetical protein
MRLAILFVSLVLLGAAAACADAISDVSTPSNNPVENRDAAAAPEEERGSSGEPDTRDAQGDDSPARDAGTFDGDCPPRELWADLNGTACSVKGLQCPSAECANPCVHCSLIVCQDLPNGIRWELNGQLACQCGETSPACVDPVTCAIEPNCK